MFIDSMCEITNEKILWEKRWTVKSELIALTLQISKTKEQVTKLKSKNSSLVNQLEKANSAYDMKKEKIEDQELELIALTLLISEVEQ